MDVCVFEFEGVFGMIVDEVVKFKDCVCLEEIVKDEVIVCVK